jgi:hypothetical protein
MKPNALGRLARRKGLCSAHGRYLLFSEQDLADIWEVMRVASRDGIRPAHDSLSGEKAMESLMERAKHKANNRRRQ